MERVALQWIYIFLLKPGKIFLSKFTTRVVLSFLWKCHCHLHISKLVQLLNSFLFTKKPHKKQKTPEAKMNHRKLIILPFWVLFLQG